ncbi:unnamed protein product [Enterobius vermicularis]|uniref:SSD domain-containing protein n=1 Tax=Enterobius vermicularis TaxID=51028 RepID=A0A0N4V3X7_ENTVE|nr:unnamed protein product [Enterobius vermicularis]
MATSVSSETSPIPHLTDGKRAKYDSLKKQSGDTKNSGTHLPSTNTNKGHSGVHDDSDRSSTWRRKKSEKALVHRIANDLQLAEFVSNNYVVRADSRHRLYLFRLVESGLRRALWYLSKAIAGRKILFTLLPIVLLLLSLIGPYFHRDTISLESPLSTFFTPTATPYPSSALCDFRDNSVSVIQEGALEVYSHIRRAIKRIGVKYGKVRYSWSDLCRESCTDDDDAIVQIITSDLDAPLTYPESLVSSKISNETTKRVEVDVDGAISHARALLLTFQLKTNLKEIILNSWDRQFHNIVMRAAIEAPKNASADVFWWSNKEFMHDVAASYKQIHTALIFSAVLLVILCCALGFGRNSYHSRPVLGFMIGILLLSSFVISYSVQLTGSNNINAAGFSIFFPLTAMIIAGFGILLFFSLKDSWQKYSNAASDPVEKLSLIMSWEGCNAVIASLIIVVSFLIIGSTTTNPYIQFVTLVFAAGVAVLLIFALLFFTVFLLISGRREAKGLKWYHVFRHGDANFPAKTVNYYDDSELTVLHDKLLDAKSSITRSMAKLGSTPYMRCPIAFLFAIYLVFACWGCKDFRVDMREEYFLARNSEARAYLENYRDMFNHYEEFLELTFDEPVDYNDPRKKEDIISLLDWAVRERYASKSVSWLKDFARFETSTIYDITAETFVPIVSHIFLATDNFKKYRADVVFDKFETQIVSSRMYLELTAKGIRERMTLIDTLLARARAMEIPLFIKAPFAFNIQHDVQVTSTVLFAFGIFMSCVCAFTLLLYGLPALTALVVLSNISVIVGVIGYASHWNIPLNIITFSVALSGNALTTVIVAYFCYYYVNAGNLQKSGESKVRYSFQSCLLPVTFACFVPLLTYTPLLTFDIPVVFHICKMLLLTSVITFAHFLLFSPSVMMFFAEQIPAFCSTVRSACEDCCCQCFEVEENSGSIYYIPTGGHNKMSDYQERNYPYLVAPPPLQRMIMQPPPGYLQVSSSMMAPDVLPYRSIEPPHGRGQHRERRRRHDSHSERSVSTAASPRLVRSAHPTPLVDRKVCSKKGHSESRSLTDSIYEAPPSPSYEKIYRKEVEIMPGRRRELYRPSYETNDLSMSRRRYHDKFRDDELDQNPSLEMRSNWRQYLIEGNLRQTNNLLKPASMSFHSTYSPSSNYYFRDTKRF